MLTLSVPQDVANVIKTKSRLRVWVRKSSYLARLSGFFSVVLQKSSISWLKKKKKKKLLTIFLSSTKTQVAIKFLKELFFFWGGDDNRLGAERF